MGGVLSVPQIGWECRFSTYEPELRFRIDLQPPEGAPQGLGSSDLPRSLALAKRYRDILETVLLE